jgi:hypothetical protein
MSPLVCGFRTRSSLAVPFAVSDEAGPKRPFKSTFSTCSTSGLSIDMLVLVIAFDMPIYWLNNLIQNAKFILEIRVIIQNLAFLDLERSDRLHADLMES